jgi:hypothetical protein
MKNSVLKELVAAPQPHFPCVHAVQIFTSLRATCPRTVNKICDASYFLNLRSRCSRRHPVFVSICDHPVQFAPLSQPAGDVLCPRFRIEL